MTLDRSLSPQPHPEVQLLQRQQPGGLTCVFSLWGCHHHSTLPRLCPQWAWAFGGEDSGNWLGRKVDQTRPRLAESRADATGTQLSSPWKSQCHHHAWGPRPQGPFHPS